MNVTRHNLATILGRRVSKGEWERRTHVYGAHPITATRGGPKLQVVDWVRNEDGSAKLGTDGKRQPIVRQCVTLVLMPDTPRFRRKANLETRKRYAPYRPPAGTISRQHLD